MKRRQLSVNVQGRARRVLPLSAKLEKNLSVVTREQSYDLAGRVAHVVGNGDSCVDFRRSSDTDFVLGCNRPHVEGVDATFICDHKFLYKIRERKAEISCPLVAPKKLANWITSNPKAKNSPAEHLRVLDTFEYGDQRIPSHSSAHYGAIWLARCGCSEIHVWGCDSLVKDTIKSKTDAIVHNPQKDSPGHGEKFARRWRANWKQVVDWYPTVKFVFHNIPSGDIHDVL